jgi:hypothetical protein
MRLLPGVGVPHLDRHRARLQASARTLGFEFDPAAFDATVAAALAGGVGAPRRLRIALAHDGRLALTQAPLAPLPPGPLRLRLGSAGCPRRGRWPGTRRPGATNTTRASAPPRPRVRSTRCSSVPTASCSRAGAATCSCAWAAAG